MVVSRSMLAETFNRMLEDGYAVERRSEVASSNISGNRIVATKRSCLGPGEIDRRFTEQFAIK